MNYLKLSSAFCKHYKYVLYFDAMACEFMPHYRFSMNHHCYSIETSDGIIFFARLTIALCGLSLIGTTRWVPIMQQQIIYVQRVTLLVSLLIIMEVKWTCGVSEC